MKSQPNQEMTYHKIEIDNSVCNRRFHIAFEQGQPELAEVVIKCPHCQVTIFEAKNHPPAILSREENLVKRPDGSRPIVYECKFIP